MSLSLREKDLKYLWHPCSQMKDYEKLPPIVIEKGEGVFLYDDEGKEYIDIISSWWANLFGHCNPKISQAVKGQVNKLDHVLLANFTHKPVIDLCSMLSEVTPKGISKFFFSNDGSSSIEAALKMAFQYHQQKNNKNKTKFACFTQSYHGETLGALAVGDVDLYTTMYKPMLMETLKLKAPDCYRCEFGKNRDNCKCECFVHAEELFKTHGEELAGIIVEPLIQGSAGMRIYPPLYLDKLRQLCDQWHVLLIADEIATGFGRTGKFFAFDHSKGSPDIMCMSKGLTGGFLPMAITAATDEIYYTFYDSYESKKAFMHSHTYSGNPLAAAAAVATLKIFQEEDIFDELNKKSAYMKSRLSEIFGTHDHIGEIRGMALINALELVEDKETKKALNPDKRTGYSIFLKALEKGLILRPLGDVIYFNPPLIIDYETIDKTLEITKNAVDQMLK